MPALTKQLRGLIHTIKGEELNRLQMKAYELDDPDQFAKFERGAARPIKVYGTDRNVSYDPANATGVAISFLGASKAISIGAYSFALASLDQIQ